MGLSLAIKAFFKALKDPKKGEEFLENRSNLPESGDFSHLRLLSLLQNSGRIVDFLKEDISKYSDAQVGAACRKIHQDCGKLLEDLVTIRPLMSEGEGSFVTVPIGYDASAIKVIGKVKGEPPYNGTLVHKGWKAHKRSLPRQVACFQNEVICPAEIEIK